MKNTYPILSYKDSMMPRQRVIWLRLAKEVLSTLKEEQPYWEVELPSVAESHRVAIARLEKELSSYLVYPLARTSIRLQPRPEKPSEQSTTHSSVPVPPSSVGQPPPNPNLPF